LHPALPARPTARSSIAAVRLAATLEDDLIVHSRAITARGEFVRPQRIQEMPGFEGFSGRRLEQAPGTQGVSREAPKAKGGGDGGIRTLDRALQPYNGLANRRLQPLGHVSNKADMPDAGATRKRQIWPGRISANYLNTKELRQAVAAM
jgi:hypothetical protein